MRDEKIFALADYREAGPDRTAVVAQSARMRETLARAERFADSTATALLTGESGTGKEVVARHMHAVGCRRDRPYVRVNCAALSESLIESELFGHCRGAFTGAEQDRVGRLQWAADGVLLLDEIGELPLRVQAKLLRVLEEGEFQRVGENGVLPLRARIVAATNRDLAGEVAAKRFRADLYYRLHVLHLDVPPLRQRQEDIPPLARHFLRMFADRPLELGRRAVGQLLEHHWPGNVRELKNVVQRAAVLCEGGRVEELEIVQLEAAAATAEQWPDVTLEEAQRRTLRAALRRCDGNKAAAARRLGVAPQTVANMLRRDQEAA